MEDKRKKFGIELSPSLHERMLARAAEDNRFLWQLYDEAIRAYLGAPASSLSSPSEEIARALEVLDSGDLESRQLLRNLINEVWKLYRLRRGLPPSE
jgi:hypothetical protein